MRDILKNWPVASRRLFVPVLPRLSEFPFYRIQVGRTIKSICTGCLQTISYSPRLEVLTIMEDAHKCLPAPFKRKN
jgi:hypothetical protein